MKNKKIKFILPIMLVLIILVSLGISYNKKVKAEELLVTQLEEIYDQYEAINISNMNIDEEKSFNNLSALFKDSISSKNLSESQNTLNQILKLESSVKSRIEKEEIAKLEKEALKIKEEEKKKLEEEAARKKAEEEGKKKSEELALLETEQASNNSQPPTSTSSSVASTSPTFSIPKISNTSVAASSSQLISVVSTGGTTAELVLWQKDSEGTWYEYDSMPAMLGQNGMKYASSVYEMDLSTPTGVYSLTEAFGVASNPGTSMPYRVLDGSEYWVDDETSEYYNTMQFGEPNGRWKSAEHLTDYQNAYKYALVIDYNRYPVIPGKSSAIFLHVDVGIPTLGCVAVSQSKMEEILTWINPNSNPKIMLAFSYDELYSY